MDKEELIKILEDNEHNITAGDWDAVYENIDIYERGEFSKFLLENDIDPSTMFKNEIPEWAFAYCKSLTSITIPDSVTSIGTYAFAYCTSLTSINILNNVTEIGRYAFSWCSSLKSIDIPNTITEIGRRAFYYCESLTSVTIPSSVTEIGGEAFYWCSKLTEIKYDGTAEEWSKVQLGKDWVKNCPVNRKKNKVTFLK